MEVSAKKITLHTITAVLMIDSAVVPILSDTGQSIHQMVFDGPMPPTEWYVRIAEYAGFLASNYFAMPEIWKDIPARIALGADEYHRRDREK